MMRFKHLIQYGLYMQTYKSKTISDQIWGFICTSLKTWVGLFTLYGYICKNFKDMFWTLELASYLEEAPWPATKDELIDYSIRSGAPIEVVENLQELEDEGEVYESIEDIWPDYPSQEDFMFNEDEY
jgi:hypothetical protein